MSMRITQLFVGYTSGDEKFTSKRGVEGYGASGSDVAETDVFS